MPARRTISSAPSTPRSVAGAERLRRLLHIRASTPTATAACSSITRSYLDVGHDEYWSGEQRANVEAARDAGVNLQFWSGNEVYWQTRWGTSIDGDATPYRTMVSYKETWAQASSIDPTNEWTGTCRDPRFSPPAIGGGKPENSLTGQLFKVDDVGANLASIKVPYDDANLRFWRNTSVANLQPGQTATLTKNYLGYEWDEASDNGFDPAGLVRLSSTTLPSPHICSITATRPATAPRPTA